MAFGEVLGWDLPHGARFDVPLGNVFGAWPCLMELVELGAGASVIPQLLVIPEQAQEGRRKCWKCCSRIMIGPIDVLRIKRFFFSTLLFTARGLSLQDCFYTGQSPDVLAGLTAFILASLQMCKIHMALSAGVGGWLWGVKGEDVAEERLGSIDVVGCGGWQMEEAACEGAHGCCRHVGRPP